MKPMEIAMKEMGELIAMAASPQSAIDALKADTTKYLGHAKDNFYYPFADIPAIDGSGDINAATIKYADVIQLYDNLAAKYPDYIVKESLGLDTSGDFTIYKYDFINSQSNDYIVLDSSIHGDSPDGDPKDPAIALYYLLVDIYDNWTQDVKLSELRWSYNYSVIPVVNPWGFDNDSRNNSNGIDCNRNFEWNFAVNGQGAAPYSEKESLYVRDNLIAIQQITRGFEKQNKVLAYLPLHSFGSGGGSRDPQFFYYCSNISPMRKVYVTTSVYLSQKYGYEPYDGVVVSSTASADNFAERILGIPSGTPEFSVYRNDGHQRDSLSITQQVEFYGNLLWQMVHMNAKPRLKLSLLSLQADQTVSFSGPAVIKDFSDGYSSNAFKFDATTGEITTPPGVEFIRITASIYLNFDSASEETMGVFAAIYRNGITPYLGYTFFEQPLRLGGTEGMKKSATIRLETPILHCPPGTSFELRMSKTSTTASLKAIGDGRTWICVEEVNRYGI